MTPTQGPGTLYCAECGRPCTPDELARFGDMMICPGCKDSYAQKLREGVAPAAAVTYAGFWIRFVAYLIDAIILTVVSSIVQFGILGSFLTGVRPQPGTSPEVMFSQMIGALGIAWLINTAMACAYETLFVAKFAATPGKMAMGLKVVRADGSAVDVARAAARYFGKMLSGIILGIGYIMAGFDAQKRALHDMLCDTRVIRTRN